MFRENQSRRPNLAVVGGDISPFSRGFESLTELVRRNPVMPVAFGNYIF
jgi:hypothetical protein